MTDDRNDVLQEIMIKAMKDHAVGHIAKHKMNVEIYLNNPAGIGEHPDVGGNPRIVEKVVRQLYNRFEVIISDDVSTDVALTTARVTSKQGRAVVDRGNS